MSAEGEVYGLLRTAGIDVALPLSALREVVPHPARLTPLPVVADGLVGAMRLRSAVLPVLDLRALLPAVDPGGAAADVAVGPPRPERRVVVVVAHGGRRVGVVMDDVRGVTRVAEADLMPLGAADRTLLACAAFQHGPDGDVTSILNAELLLTLPGLPTVAEPDDAAPDHAAPDHAAPDDAAPDHADHADAPRRAAERGHLTVVRCGEHRLAIDIEHVRAMISLGDLRPGLLTGGDCLGTVVHDGLEVPVLDPLRLLGLEPVGDRSTGMVVDLGTGLVVLAVSALDRLMGPGRPRLAVPAWATRRADLVPHVVKVDDVPCLVLDADALRADRDLLAYAALTTEAASTSAAGGRSAGPAAPTDAPTYLTYVVGGRTVASPLSQVAEILPLPAVLTPSAVEHVVGILVHRGRSVPLVRLAGLLAPEASDPWTCLLLVDAGDEQVAFAVDRLGSITPRVWVDPEWRRGADARADPASTIRQSALIQVADLDLLVPDLDLAGLARRVGAIPAATEGDHHVDHALVPASSPAA